MRNYRPTLLLMLRKKLNLRETDYKSCNNKNETQEF